MSADATAALADLLPLVLVAGGALLVRFVVWFCIEPAPSDFLQPPDVVARLRAQQLARDIDRLERECEIGPYAPRELTR